ncbi:hypothetical protein BEI02_18790 [Elizabethkingia sp. HvH-WGS333]|jgi:hypothetical protein|nr:hypothetical protein AMC91_01995 [Elizabethkingia miricola]OIK44894.1 hypothetical protein BEI02_18790 [Elizabethkingia sp. HvH-WGS333]
MINIHFLKKINKVVIFSLFAFLSCSSDKKDSLDLSIKFIGQKLYLKEPDSKGEYMTPPIINWNFTVKNNTNVYKLFIDKYNSDDEVQSRLYMIDTVRNKILPLHASSIYKLGPNDVKEITVSVPLRNELDFFNFPKNFFDKLDYSEDSIKIKKIGDNLIKNSLIIYIPNNSDINIYKRTGENRLQEIRNQIIIVDK